ncbi:MAG: Pvc16 family protein, partial [Chloroflexota bacterium]
MLSDLDDTIRELLVRTVPLDPTEVELAFDTPDREWSSRLTRPAVNCFLFDVRENLKMRAVGWEVKRNGENNVGGRQRA